MSLTREQEHYWRDCPSCAALRAQIELKDKIIAGDTHDRCELEREMEAFGLAFSDEHGGLDATAVIVDYVKKLHAQLDQSMTRQETLAKNVNDGLLEIRSLRADKALLENNHAVLLAAFTRLAADVDLAKEKQAQREVVELRAECERLKADLQEAVRLVRIGQPYDVERFANDHEE